jgi:hypothetical protein
MFDEDGLPVDVDDATAARTPPTIGMLITGQPLRFQAPKSFSGKDNEFELFSYKLKAFLNLSNPLFRATMNDAAKSTSEIEFSTLAQIDK